MKAFPYFVLFESQFFLLCFFAQGAAGVDHYWMYGIAYLVCIVGSVYMLRADAAHDEWIRQYNERKKQRESLECR